MELKVGRKAKRTREFANAETEINNNKMVQNNKQKESLQVYKQQKTKTKTWFHIQTKMAQF